MTRISLALAVLILANVASAQPAAPHASASDVAQWVHDFYARTSSMQMEFRQFAWTQAYDRTDSSRGTLRIARPGHVRFDYATPAGTVIVGDGADITSYEPVEGTAGQYWRGRSDAAARALGVLTGDTDITRDFTMSIREEAGGPAHTVCLELVPRSPDAYARMRLAVTELAASRGIVLQLAIEDHHGNWNTFQFPARGTQIDPVLAPGTFDFRPPPGAREITPPSR